MQKRNRSTINIVPLLTSRSKCALHRHASSSNAQPTSVTRSRHSKIPAAEIPIRHPKRPSTQVPANPQNADPHLDLAPASDKAHTRVHPQTRPPLLRSLASQDEASVRRQRSPHPDRNASCRTGRRHHRGVVSQASHHVERPRNAIDRIAHAHRRTAGRSKQIHYCTGFATIPLLITGQA